MGKPSPIARFPVIWYDCIVTTKYVNKTGRIWEKIMWTLIFGSIFLGTILGIVYLSCRFSKFAIICRAAKKRKGICFLAGFILVIVILASIWVTLGSINAMVCIIHLMVIWMVCDGICKIIEKKRKMAFKRYYAGACAIVTTVIYLACGWYLAHNVWSTKYALETDKQVGSLRIVQFADSHVGTTFDGAGFAEKLKAIQAENPDIVVVTGDYIDDDTTKEDMLQDENVLLDNRFYLIGRQDRSEEVAGGARASMEELADGLDHDKYIIVLDHQPHDYDAQEAAGADLVLSGHTHGGQLFPVNYLGELTGTDDKRYGLEKRGNTNFIVTSSISDWAIKFKTGCKSEYVVVDIQGK